MSGRTKQIVNLTHIVQGEQESLDVEPSKEVELEVEVNIRFIFTTYWLHIGSVSKGKEVFLVLLLFHLKGINMYIWYLIN